MSILVLWGVWKYDPIIHIIPILLVRPLMRMIHSMIIRMMIIMILVTIMMNMVIIILILVWMVVMDSVVDIIFFIDIIFNFHTSFVSASGEVVTDQNKIRR